MRTIPAMCERVVFAQRLVQPATPLTAAAVYHCSSTGELFPVFLMYEDALTYLDEQGIADDEDRRDLAEFRQVREEMASTEKPAGTG